MVEPGRPLRLSGVVVIALAASACSRASPQRFEYAQVIMGVEARIILYATDKTTARRAARSAFERMADLDAVMSDYRRDSELMTASRSAGTGHLCGAQRYLIESSGSERAAPEKVLSHGESSTWNGG